MVLIRSSSGGCDLLQSEAPSGRSRSSAIVSIARTHCDRAISIRGPRSSSHLGDAWTSLERPIFIKSRAPSDGQDNSQKNSMIAVRSNRNRGAIEPRSWIFCHGIISMSIKWHSLRIEITIYSRSWPNRSAIVARSWCFLEAKWKLKCRGIEATIYANGIAPSTPLNRSHDRFNCPRFVG